MAKYKVAKVFTDAYTKRTYRVGEVIELTEERVEEMEARLEPFGGAFIKPAVEKENVEVSEVADNQEMIDDDREPKEEKPKKTTKKK